jgi:hypothetical protein
VERIGLEASLPGTGENIPTIIAKKDAKLVQVVQLHMNNFFNTSILYSLHLKS